MQCIPTLLEHKPNFRESNNCDYAMAKGIYFQPALVSIALERQIFEHKEHSYALVLLRQIDHTWFQNKPHEIESAFSGKN